jgi:hypothetical protein
MGTQAQFIWQPSTSRVATVDGFGPYPRGIWQTTPEPMTWPTKDPGDTLDYVLDLSKALAGDDGDSIKTLDVSISPANPGDLLMTQSTVDGDLAVLWLSSGVAGTTYAVTIVAGTNSGRAISRTVGLAVATLSTPSPFGNDITDQLGAALTDQSGNAITAN